MENVDTGDATANVKNPEDVRRYDLGNKKEKHKLLFSRMGRSDHKRLSLKNQMKTEKVFSSAIPVWLRIN